VKFGSVLGFKFCEFGHELGTIGVCSCVGERELKNWELFEP